MSGGNKKQYKQYAINTVQDALGVLAGLIKPVEFNINKFSQYSLEVQELSVQFSGREEIPAKEYENVHDKLLYRQRELLRYLADHQNSSFSYINVRPIFIKQGYLQRDLSEEATKTLNELLDIRNWSFHNIQSMMVAEKEMAAKSIPEELRGNLVSITPLLNPIILHRRTAYKYNMVIGLMEHNTVRGKQFKMLYEEMKKDYQEMYEFYLKEAGLVIFPQVQYIEQRATYDGEGRDAGAVMLSMGIQKGKYDGTDASYKEWTKKK